MLNKSLCERCYNRWESTGIVEIIGQMHYEPKALMDAFDFTKEEAEALAAQAYEEHITCRASMSKLNVGRDSPLENCIYALEQFLWLTGR